MAHSEESPQKNISCSKGFGCAKPDGHDSYCSTYLAKKNPIDCPACQRGEPCAENERIENAKLKDRISELEAAYAYVFGMIGKPLSDRQKQESK